MRIESSRRFGEGLCRGAEAGTAHIVRVVQELIACRALVERPMRKGRVEDGQGTVEAHSQMKSVAQQGNGIAGASQRHRHLSTSLITLSGRAVRLPERCLVCTSNIPSSDVCLVA